MSELRRFAVEDGSDITTLVSGLEQRASFAREPDLVLVRTVYDTFDWRIDADGGVLELDRRAPARARRAIPDTWLVWRDAATAEVRGRIAVEDVPAFVWDLPDTPTTRRLADVVEMRALRPLVTIRSERVTLALTDREGKTEARVVLDQASVLGNDDEPDQVLPPTIEVQPVRGYDRAADRVTDLLAAQVVLRPVERDVVDQALDLVGLVPGDYTSKLRLQLDGEAPALESVAIVVGTLLATMAANEPGTRADTDSEFLHDYRVAVRRTRSVLGMAKHVIEPGLLEHLRTETKWLGDITTPTRDLDVWVLTYPEFEATLPETVRSDLQPLQAFLVDHQRRAHDQLVAELDSDRYAALMERLRSWLAEPRVQRSSAGPDATPEADEPTVVFAASRIWKAYRSLVKDARRITPDSPPVRLHDLRKDAKKLRYALECFGSVFPPGELADLIKELKGVQDVLGEFQDCEVQKGSLRHFGEQLAGEQGADAAPTLLAMGYLVEQLDERERQARSRFADCFEVFDRHHNRAHFRRLFGPDASTHPTHPQHPLSAVPQEQPPMSVEP